MPGIAVCRRNTDETMRLQQKMAGSKFILKICQTCEHVNAEKEHE